ncbi:MAG: glycosyltransferase [Bdellovibrionales bacterium]|nr:glycosyltransferase [Bdellovibrionales bacterium]
MLASIIIPTHRRHRSVLNLLSSLENQDFPKDEFEILIISNLPDPSLRKQIEKQIDGRLLYDFFEVGELGVNRARNLGISKAKGKFLFFLDDDCFANQTFYLKKGIELLRRWPEASAVGGPYSLGPKSSTIEQVYNSICRQWLENSVRKSGYTVNLVGGNMVFHATVFSSGLRFNESIVFGGAETELNSRLVQQGYRLKYDPNYSIEHRVHLTLRTFFSKAFWQGFGAQRREQANLPPDIGLSSIFSACPYPSRLNEFYLAFFNHGFQMGQEWAKHHLVGRPSLIELATLFVFFLKKGSRAQKIQEMDQIKSWSLKQHQGNFGHATRSRSARSINQ